MIPENFERKPGFVYIDSKELGQIIAISEKTGKAYCQDGTVYSAAEIEILKKNGGIALPVHLIKKQFRGTIIEIKE